MSAPPAEEAKPVPDLMAALEASIKAAKDGDEDGKGARKAPRKRGAIHHLTRKYLQLEQQPVIGKPRQSAAPIGIVHGVWPWRKAILRIFMPVQLLPDAARGRQLRQTLEQ